MTGQETFRTALDNLATHKLRTALTMLGMIFGVGAVIAMLSIGAGGERKALEAIGRLGLRNVIVRAKVVKPEDRQELRKKSLGVSLRDAEAIAEAVPNVTVGLRRTSLSPTPEIASDAAADRAIAASTCRGAATGKSRTLLSSWMASNSFSIALSPLCTCAA